MLEKIKTFLKKLFGRENVKYIEAPKEVITSIVNQQEQKVTDFKNQIMLNNKEKSILELQQKFKLGEIQEEDLTEEEFNGLTKLYEEQITKTKQSIQRYKNKIIAAKSKLAQNN